MATRRNFNVTPEPDSEYRSIEHYEYINSHCVDDLTRGKCSVVIPVLYIQCEECKRFSKETVHHCIYYKTIGHEWLNATVICRCCGSLIFEFNLLRLGDKRETISSIYPQTIYTRRRSDSSEVENES